MSKIKVPSVRTAKKLLAEASRLNPGPWVKHSMFVALAAKNIAQRCDHLDPYIAYTVGLLHDIGRRFGVSHIKHIFDGYRYLSELGYPFVAQIALTHSFPIKEVKSYFGKMDCSRKDLIFLKSYLHKINYSQYDELIQLCDALALPSGLCLLEKRMIDVYLRHGPTDFMREKWLETFEIKKKFEKIVGISIYEVLPGVKKNTFV